MNSKKVEFKPGEKEIGSSGNKRPVNSTLSLFPGLLLPHDSISFSPGLNSTSHSLSPLIL